MIWAFVIIVAFAAIMVGLWVQFDDLYRRAQKEQDTDTDSTGRPFARLSDMDYRLLDAEGREMEITNVHDAC